MTEIHQTIEELKRFEELRGIPSERFAREKLKISGGTWSQIKAGKYTLEPGTKVVENIEQALEILREDAAQPEWKKHDWPIVQTAPLRAGLTGFKDCLNDTQNRLFIYLAPQGGGKTTFRNFLKGEFKDSCISADATEPWKNSYMATLVCVCDAAGLGSGYYQPIAAQNALLDRLRKKVRVLVIDEAHYLGRASINLVLAILNQTNTAVVLLGTPKLWNKMIAGAEEEISQLRRRVKAKMEFSRLTEADIRLVLKSRLAGFTADMIAPVMASANKFGLFDTVSEICARALQNAKGKTVDLAEIETAIQQLESVR